MSTNTLSHSYPARILHWLNAVFMVFLITTGLYMSNPNAFPFFLSMDMARKIHFIVMYLLIYGFIFRVYYACVNGELRNFIPSFRELGALPKVIAYYLFLSKTMPEYKRYNPAQKLMYMVWALLIIVQAVTGFALYKPETIGKFLDFLGGPVDFRKVHLLAAWFFVVTLSLHVYLAFISGWQNIKSIVVDISETKKPKRAFLKGNPKNRL